MDRSPLAAALERVGDRWSLMVVEALLDGPRRWSDLAGAVEGIAPNILSDRLKRLEREGVVATAAYSERPVRVAYELTAAGRELAGALRLLAGWGGRRVPDAEPIRHEACGTPVEARWFCPTCERTVGEDEAQELRIV
jgi:DNA-binding HxlR family transcriptional regulator